MARLLSIVLLGVLVAGSALNLPMLTGSASAAELDKKSKADVKEAMGLYKAGRYEEAAKICVNLSVAYPDMLIFVRNLGACYYYLRQVDPALSNLREYLARGKEITADDRVQVEGWIGELEHLRSQVAAPPASAVVTSVSAATSPAAASVESSPQLPATAPVAASAPGIPPTPYPAPQPYAYPPAPGIPPTPYPAPQPYAYPPASGIPPTPYPAPQPYAYPPAWQYSSPPGSSAGQYSPQPAMQYPPTVPSQGQGAPAAGLGAETRDQAPVSNNNTAWIVGGVGVALVATGGVFTYLSQSAFSDTAKRYSASRESAGKTYADVAGVFYGIGAAGVATAVIMIAIVATTRPIPWRWRRPLLRMPSVP